MSTGVRRRGSWNGRGYTALTSQPFSLPYQSDTSATSIRLGSALWASSFTGEMAEVAIYPPVLGLNTLGSHASFSTLNQGAVYSPATTAVRRFEPWKPDSKGFDHPAPGLALKKAHGTCDSGSTMTPAVPTPSGAFRPGNGAPCFHPPDSGDPGSPLLCSTDPTSNQAVLLDQGGSQLPLNFANKEEPGAPAWVLVLANGKKCYHLGYGTDTAVLSYHCGGNVGATVPNRSSPLWTVQEGRIQVNPRPSGPRIAVLTAYR